MNAHDTLRNTDPPGTHLMRKKAAYLCAVVVVLCGCRGLKNASPERPLFADYTVEFTTAPEVDALGAREELEGVVTPAPNNSLLGMRPTVALHNMMKEPKVPNKGLRNLLKYKIGSRPVYLDEVPLADVDAALVNRMNNRGYFHAKAHHVVEQKGRTAKVTFTVEPGLPHRLRTIVYADTVSAHTDSLNARIAMAQRRSPLKAGDPYRLAQLVEERTRVAGTLRNHGYYRLRDDDLVFLADTSLGGRQADIQLRVKRDIAPEKRMRYIVDDVHVHGDMDPLLAPSDTTVVDSLFYIDYLGMYRPHTITRGVFVQPGKPYSQRSTESTQRYLSSYSVFSGVQVNYREDTVMQGLLHADVVLTPQKRFSLFSELNATSKSNNFAGPGLKAGFTDRDLFRGAEIFTVDLNGRFETQISGADKGTNAYEIGAKASLSIPRRLLIGRGKRPVRSYVPTTRFEAAYGFFRRIGLYGLESASLSYGYLWRTSARVWHDVRIPEISYSNLYYTSPEFNEFLFDNPSIRRSLEEQFILSISYTYTRSTQRGNKDRSWMLMSFGVDESANLLDQVFQLARGPRPEGGYTLLGEPYSQYVRVRPELRWYQALGTHGSQLVTRVLASAAYAYGNTTTVPYVKQFYSGGTNSLRAFRARSVGPGTYAPSDQDMESSNLLIDQVGDIKFEANLEYRATISGYFKGALFVDAGNVWLLRDDPQRPGGKFDLNTAVDELAVGAGMGLRFDPEVIVVRLDLATPLRRPDLPPGDRWVLDDQAPKLADNFILNIAIGYPF